MDKLVQTTPLILPKGYRHGLLPRTDQPGDSCPFIRSAPGFNLIPRQEWSAYVEAGANLSGHVWNVFNQGSIGSCFPPSTSIRMGDGSKKQIGKVKLYDKVLTAEGNKKSVTSVMTRPHHGKIIKLDIDKFNSICMTPEHPVLTNDGYVAAKFLQKNHYVSFNSKPYTVKDISYDSYSNDVFNLEVDGDHSYVVEGLGVHNCASESVDGGLAIVREQTGLPRVLFNPYGTYGRVNGGSDRGSTLSANLTFARDYGAFPESVWPRSEGWRKRPSEEAFLQAFKYRLDEYYEISNFDEFGSALLNQWTIYFGISGHAIVGVDLINESQFWYLNSWSTGWGKDTQYSNTGGGFSPINRSSIFWNYGCYAMRTPIIEADLDITI